MIKKITSRLMAPFRSVGGSGVHVVYQGNIIDAETEDIGGRVLVRFEINGNEKAVFADRMDFEQAKDNNFYLDIGTGSPIYRHDDPACDITEDELPILVDNKLIAETLGDLEDIKSGGGWTMKTWLLVGGGVFLVYYLWDSGWLPGILSDFGIGG